MEVIYHYCFFSLVCIFEKYDIGQISTSICSDSELKNCLMLQNLDSITKLMNGVYSYF